MVLTKEGAVVPIPPKGLKTLLALIECEGKVATKQQLIETVWPDSFIEEGNLTQNIFLLRRELGLSPSGEDYIQTLPKRGYRFTAQVRVVEVEDLENGPAAAAPPSEPVALLPEVEHRKRNSVMFRLLLIGCGALLLAILGVAAEWYREIPRPPRVSGFSKVTHDGEIKRVRMEQVGGPQVSLFSDGTRIYFNEGSSDAPVVVQVSAQGSDTARLEVPVPLPTLLDVSNPRSEMLVAGSVGPADAPPLWILPLPAGPARPLSGITAWDASWSADGRNLAYVRGREIFIANGDGSGSKRLASLSGNGWHPRWSPDGKRIRLTVWDIPRSIGSLWEVQSDGSGLHPLLPDWQPATTSPHEPVDVCCGTWSPDGKDYVFQVSQRGRSDIWWLPGREGWLRRSLGVHAVRPVRVTAGQLSSLSPAFSSDGRRLFVIGQELRGELQRFDRRVGQFVSFLGGPSAELVDFSRDGKWILYVTYPEAALWRMRSDGTDRTQLTFLPMEAWGSRWSPDGMRILTFLTGDGMRRGVSLISAEGGKPQPASREGGEMQPSWSPDGSSIMYSDFPFFSEQPAKVSVHIRHLDTGLVETLPGSEGLFAPQWSPDGQHATAMVLNGQMLELYDFRSRLWSQLTPGWGFVHWSADSRWIYYLRYGPSPAILRQRIADGHVEEVAGLQGFRLAGRLAGLDFGVTPQGEPIVTRDVGTQEVYSMDWANR
jgi:DNA-binding winged helix-turn-helix (wHTH) protein/Tol biopolymer transport system component